MKTSDLISMALRNLSARKLRTFLTVLGVIIGCASIVVMVSLGVGMTRESEEWIASMGNLREIKVFGKSSTKTGKEEKLTDKHINQFLEIPNVEDAFGILTFDGGAGYVLRAKAKYEDYAEIVGIDPKYMEKFGIELADGDYPKKKDEFFAIYGNEIKNSFWRQIGNSHKQIQIDLKKDKMDLFSRGYDDGVTQTKDKSIELKYSGETTESGNYNISYSVFVPIDAVRKLMIKEEENKPYNQRDKDIKHRYSRIVIIVDTINNVKAIKEQLTDEGYQVDALTDMLEDMKKQTVIIQAIFGGIGAVSLLVAAIGISNTMVMSIQERTREIGIMKVIGASINDIRALFLIEAATIGLMGGIIGLIISYIASFVLNHVASNFGEVSQISIIPIGLALGALVFTSLIGIVSGYFPARRAMKIPALDAMRS